jgi:hypothetical protein
VLKEHQSLQTLQRAAATQHGLDKDLTRTYRPPLVRERVLPQEGEDFAEGRKQQLLQPLQRAAATQHELSKYLLAGSGAVASAFGE